MLEQNQKELDGLMNKYQGDLSGLQQKRTEVQAAQAAFMAEFKRLKKDVIWPTLIDIGNYLNKFGHDYHIEEHDELIDATAHFTPACLTFNIYPATLDRASYRPDCTPYISFTANRYAGKVGIMVSTMMPNKGGVIGAHGEYSPSDITKELVENEVISVLKNSLIFHQEK